MAAQPLLEFGHEGLSPALKSDVVECNVLVGEHPLQVAQADRELQIPPNGPENNLGREAEAAECPGMGSALG